MNNKKYFIIFIIGVVVLFVIYIVIPEQKQEGNEQLNSEQSVTLFKQMRGLEKSVTLTEKAFTDESMIKFAESYIALKNPEQCEYNAEEQSTIINVNIVYDTVKYIFDSELDMSKVTYEVKDGKMHIPNDFYGGDAQVYKYKSKEYNKETDTYVIYIDCLEPTGTATSEIFKDTTTSYDPKYVVATMQIKYRIKDDRYVFLAYNLEMVGNK